MLRSHFWNLPLLVATLLFGPASNCLATEQSPTRSGNASAIFDAYLARAALTTPHYRTDVALVRPNESVPIGRIAAHSPLIGRFSYRPKTYRELAPEERVALLREPELRAFLFTLGATADSPTEKTPAVGDHADSSGIIAFSISPEAMLSRARLFIVLPSPP